MTAPRELEAAFDRIAAIFPPRSLTGMGNRRCLDVLETICGPIRRIEIESGTRAFDWTVPPEYNVNEAYIITPSGKRICDVRTNHLHLLGYSTPFRGVLSKQELQKHLHSLPENPEAIVYRTSYYVPAWGFCIAHKDREALTEGAYQVICDTTLAPGHLTLGEVIIPGETEREILIWSYICHPATMCHHDLSANLAWAGLIKRVAAWPHRRYTYRFVAGAETIGSLAYFWHQSARGVHGTPYEISYIIKSNPKGMIRRTIAGYVMTCLGRGAWNYKRSQRGDTLADRAAEYVLERMPAIRYGAWAGGEMPAATVRDFHVDEGSDELVFNRFGLPVGSLMRDPYNHFPEYHTAQDSKATISFQTIADSIDVYERVLKVIEANRVYRCPIVGVPQLGRRGLYSDADVVPQTVLYQLSDGSADLLDLARRTGLDIHVLADAAKRAAAAQVLEEVHG